MLLNNNLQFIFSRIMKKRTSLLLLFILFSVISFYVCYPPFIKGSILMLRKYISPHFFSSDSYVIYGDRFIFSISSALFIIYFLVFLKKFKHRIGAIFILFLVYSIKFLYLKFTFKEFHMDYTFDSLGAGMVMFPIVILVYILYLFIQLNNKQTSE